MSLDKIAITKLCMEACEEFHEHGFKKDIDPRTLKESYNISKHQNGVWYKDSKPSLHTVVSKSVLDFTKMPILKKLTDSIDELDLDFKKKGGRVFITENLVYKIIKGTSYPIISTDMPTFKTVARFKDLCDEILTIGQARDRYRSDETYIISKTSNGEWFMTISHENLSAKKILLNLEKMPQLKIMANKINKLDSSFLSNGGRLFITLTRIYRIKNKVEIDFKI